MDTGQVLVAKPTNPHLQASTLKALSALILIPIPDKNAAIIVKPDGVNVDGTHVPLVAGTIYSLGALLQGRLMASGNDAAYALARGNQGVP